MITAIIKIFRPQQYLKNLFIFLPLFFVFKFTHLTLLVKTIWAFLSFCLIASSMYIFNDLHDIQEDRLHPRKQNRPIASGKISKKIAVITMSVSFSLGILISLILDKRILLLVAFYVLLNILYTVKFKHIPIIDIVVIGANFVIRLFVGSIATATPLSEWIVMNTFLLAVFLSLAKRRDDLFIFLNSGQRIRKCIEGYNLEFLNFSIVTMASVVIVTYIMYTVSDKVVMRFQTENVYLSSAFVILGIIRYLQITFLEKNSGEPGEVLIRDRFIQLCIAGWLVFFTVLYYREGILAFLRGVINEGCSNKIPR